MMAYSNFRNKCTWKLIIISILKFTLFASLRSNHCTTTARYVSTSAERNLVVAEILNYFGHNESDTDSTLNTTNPELVLSYPQATNSTGTNPELNLSDPQATNSTGTNPESVLSDPQATNSTGNDNGFLSSSGIGAIGAVIVLVFILAFLMALGSAYLIYRCCGRRHQQQNNKDKELKTPSKRNKNETKTSATPRADTPCTLPSHSPEPVVSLSKKFNQAKTAQGYNRSSNLTLDGSQSITSFLESADRAYNAFNGNSSLMYDTYDDYDGRYPIQTSDTTKSDKTPDDPNHTNSNHQKKKTRIGVDIAGMSIDSSIFTQTKSTERLGGGQFSFESRQDSIENYRY